MKARVKVKAVKDKELGDMFNQMLGAGNVNVQVCYPRYLQMKGYVEKVLQVLDLFNNQCKFYESFPELLPCRVEINQYIERTKGLMAKDYFIDLSAYEWNLNNVDEELVKKFGQLYEDFKKSEVMNVLISVCDNLIAYKKYLGESAKLSHKFILSLPGVEFCPLPFTKLNIKYVVSSAVSGETSNNSTNPMVDLVLTVLNKLLNLTHNLYKLISTPDIDIDEFVRVVMNNVDEARKRIPRCNKAFDKLIKSVEMLKDNFSTYYRDFVQSSNSTIIIENFVLDVAKNTKADAELMRQFRTIISYYKKVAASQVKNPQVQGLLDKINEQFSKFDKFSNIRGEGGASEGDVNIDDDDLDSDDSDETPAEDSEELKKADETRRMQEENAKKSVDELVNDIMSSGKEKSPKKTGKK